MPIYDPSGSNYSSSSSYGPSSGSGGGSGGGALFLVVFCFLGAIILLCIQHC